MKQKKKEKLLAKTLRMNKLLRSFKIKKYTDKQILETPVKKLSGVLGELNRILKQDIKKTLEQTSGN
jgi:hypothetical protein